MSLRDGPFGGIRVPLTWTAGVAVVVALVAALAMLLGDRRETMRAGAYAQVRSTADTVTKPAGEVLSAPIRWLGGMGDAIGGYIDAGGQNRDLKAQLVQAQKWRDEVLALREENARYRALMGVKTDPPLPMVFARTLLESHGPFANTRLADAGADKGVIEGNPVLGEHGLVGRVVGVAPGVSRILLLTDPESRTPVLILRTNARAILTGDGAPEPTLEYLRTHDPLIEGDRVLSSGDGGVYPRGLPVGVVVKGLNGEWRVALDSDNGSIDYVQILLFHDFSQLAQTTALKPSNLPTAMTEQPNAAIAGPAAAPAPPKPATAAPKPAAAAAATPKPAPAAPRPAAAASRPPTAHPATAVAATPKPVAAAKPLKPKPAATPKPAGAAAVTPPRPKPPPAAHHTDVPI